MFERFTAKICCKYRGRSAASETPANHSQLGYEAVPVHLREGNQPPVDLPAHSGNSVHRNPLAIVGSAHLSIFDRASRHISCVAANMLKVRRNQRASDGLSTKKPDLPVYVEDIAATIKALQMDGRGGKSSSYRGVSAVQKLISLVGSSDPISAPPNARS